MDSPEPKLVTGSGRAIRVYIFSGNERFRNGAGKALSPFYMVSSFDNDFGALLKMIKSPPDAAIIDTELPPNGGADLIREMREVEKLKGAPVLAISHSKDPDHHEEIKAAGPDQFLTWPMLKSTFLKAISNLANSSVERSWDELPPLQATVLRETVNVFRNSFHGVRDGEPLPVAQIEDSCEPLIEAVRSNQIGGILKGVRSHDDYTYVHSLRVSIHLSLLGNAMGIKGDDLKTLAVGGLVHDIGKSMVPVEILNKPAKLSDDEWPLMRDHVKHSEDILDRTPEIGHGIKIIAMQHHEKLGGGGYPRGIKGNELNDLARMATIVDIYGALTDRRPYKPPMEPVKAMGIIMDMKDELDMGMAGLFRELLLDAAAQVA